MKSPSAAREWKDFIRHGTLQYDKPSSTFNGRGIVVLVGKRRQLRQDQDAPPRVGAASLASARGIPLPQRGAEFDPEAEPAGHLYPNGFFEITSRQATTSYQLTKEGILGVNYQYKTAAVINPRFCGAATSWTATTSR